MVVKVYVSGISGNKEVKKRQQRVLMILDSKSIKYDVIDITEPGKESDKDFMQNNSTSNGGTVSDPNPRSPLPPQLFNDEEYCGDYDLFDLANEVDTLEQFLKVEVPPEQLEPVENDKATLNGDVSKASKENSQEKEVTEVDNPAEEATNEKEMSPVKEGTPSRDANKVASKEATPAREEGDGDKESTKEASPEKESSPAREKSVDKEGTPAKEESPAKEVEEPKEVSEAPAANESVNGNGAVSSRDHSEEKVAASDVDAVERKKDVSELLIESEQTAAAE